MCKYNSIDIDIVFLIGPKNILWVAFDELIVLMNSVANIIVEGLHSFIMS